jgi:hypothetical protein
MIKNQELENFKKLLKKNFKEFKKKDDKLNIL